MHNAEWTGSGEFGGHGTVIGRLAWTRRELIDGRSAEWSVVVVTWLTEMCGTKTEPNGDRATESAFELQIVLAVRWALLTLDRRTAGAQQLRWIELDRRGGCTFIVTTIIRFRTLVAQVVRKLVQCKAERIIKIGPTFVDDGWMLLELLKAQAQQRFALQIFVDHIQRSGQVLERGMVDRPLTQ